MRPAWVTVLVMLPGHRGQGLCSALHSRHLSLGPCSVLGLDVKWKVLSLSSLSAGHVFPYAIPSLQEVSSLMTMLRWRKPRMARGR